MLLSQRKYIDWVPFVVIIVLGLTVSLLPLLITGIFAANELVSLHLKITHQFTKQFWSGDLYPRWLINMNGGLGSPLFFFHGPFSNYITSFFSVVFKDAKGWIPLILSASSALIFSGFTAFLWLREITDKSVALFGTVIYMIFPYHLAVSLYWRFSLTEQWSFVWLPLLLYFTIKIIQGERFYIIGYGICYAALVLTQLSAALIYTIVPIGYGLVLTNRYWWIFSRLFIATGIGVGLSAIYWYPAYTMQQYITLKTDKIFFYANNFLFKVPSEILDTQLWKYLEIVSILTAVIAGCVWAIARYNMMREYVRESLYWFVLAITSVLMCTPLSQPIWTILPPLQSISLPWIFNIILLISTTALLSLAVYTVGNPLPILIDKPIKIVIILIGSLILALLQILPLYLDNFAIFKTNNTVLVICLILLLTIGISFIKVIMDFSHQRTLIIAVLLTASLLISSAIVIPERLSNKPRDLEQKLAVSMDLAKFRLQWVPAKLFNIGNLKSYLKNPNKAKFISGQGTIKTPIWQPRNIVFQIETNKEAIIKVNQYYYPGWSASITNEQEVKILPTKYSENDGLIQFNLPPGKSEVHLDLEVTALERAGQIITLLSILSLLGWLIFSYYKKVPIVTEARPDEKRHS